MTFDSTIKFHVFFHRHAGRKGNKLLWAEKAVTITIPVLFKTIIFAPPPLPPETQTKQTRPEDFFQMHTTQPFCRYVSFLFKILHSCGNRLMIAIALCGKYTSMHNSDLKCNFLPHPNTNMHGKTYHSKRMLC